MASVLRNIRVIILVAGVLLVMGVACEEFIIGSAQEGETVSLQLELADIQDPSQSSQLIRENYAIESVKVGLRSVGVSSPNGQGQNFVLPDSFIVFDDQTLELKVSEKIIPSGVYDILNVVIAPVDSSGNGNSGNSVADQGTPDLNGKKRIPDFKNPLDRSIRSHDSGKSNISPAHNSAPKASNTQEAEDFSIQIKGDFQGTPFTYKYTEKLGVSFSLNPILNLRKKVDSVLVVELLLDYPKWFEGPGNNQPLDPNNPANKDKIDQNISQSLDLNWGRSDRNPGGGNELPVISINDTSAVEGDDLTFTLSLDKTWDELVTVEYATQDNSAKAGEDYNGIDGEILEFQPGETEKTITVSTIEDQVDERDEQFALNLSNPENARLQGAQGKGTILDDDGSAPELSIDDVRGSEDAGTFTFTVSLSEVAGSDVTVNYETADGTATAGEDYEAITSTTLTIPSGESSATVDVTIIDDSANEDANENFFVNLSDASGASIADGQGEGTIRDNDNGGGGGGGAPELSISNESGPEDVGTLSFTVSLSAAAAADVTVDYATADDTAVEGEDYNQASGTLTFSSGETSKTIDVGIIDDSVDEPNNEKFFVNLSNVNAEATIADGQGEGTIRDNDNGGGGGGGAANLSINDVSGDEDIGTMVFTVSLSSSASQAITVDYATADNTATAGEDYTSNSSTLTFNPGETSKNVSINIIDDTIDEGT
ncbi:MAG: Calx-beta domain-containing protein, partial [Balneolaceae bacterium]|nr:Calx-beta domain-containing protein [Balneolaceae bacterium]